MFHQLSLNTSVIVLDASKTIIPPVNTMDTVSTRTERNIKY